MTNEELKTLEDKLWDAANNFRANTDLKSSEYATPILGLIFLKFADNKYKAHEAAIKKEYEHRLKTYRGDLKDVSIEKVANELCGFYIPDYARYDYLVKAKGEGVEIENEEGKKELLKTAGLIKRAMKGIEQYQDEKFKNVLPQSGYDRIEDSDKNEDSDILSDLLGIFNDIPEDAEGDVFGRIYEYFLGKFAMAEGQKGGQFFTPTSVVKLIVNIIEPYKPNAKVFDPACGSGGMFVQSAHFIEQNRKGKVNEIVVHGQEKTGDTVKLAKMNLMVNGLRGDIVQANSYEENPFNSFGEYDFVMANPPFNVKGVKEGTVKDDERFTEYGLPKTKGKDTKISDGNYLWVSLFATSLNDTGRAGFVMANSASDARGEELEIRKRIIHTGMVDVMVSMPSNMFLTVTLPATLWFFDKGKINTDRKDKILFIDARNTFRQIDRAHRDWTEEHQQNLATIVRLYRGENNRLLELVESYFQKANEVIEPSKSEGDMVTDAMKSGIENLDNYLEKVAKLLTKKQKEKQTEFSLTNKIATFKKNIFKVELSYEKALAVFQKTYKSQLDNKVQHKSYKTLSVLSNHHQAWQTYLNDQFRTFQELIKWVEKNLKVKNNKTWQELGLNVVVRNTGEALAIYTKSSSTLIYFTEQIEWLQSNFSKGKYEDVKGLCKMADVSDVEEQGYSLNSGRYVEIVVEEDNLTAKEFKAKLSSLYSEFEVLNKEAKLLEESISANKKLLIND